MEGDGFETSAKGQPTPADYRTDYSDDGLSKEDRLVLVSVLFEIMKSFVQLGYGMEPVNKLIAEFQMSADNGVDLLEYEDEKAECNDE